MISDNRKSLPVISGGEVLQSFSEQDNDRVDILIYSPLSGVMHSKNISLMSGDVHSIEVNYPAE